MKYKIAELLNKAVTKIILAIMLGFIVGAIVLAFAGYNPFDCYSMMITSIFSSPLNIVQVMILTMPNILTGLSVALHLRQDFSISVLRDNTLWEQWQLF